MRETMKQGRKKLICMAMCLLAGIMLWLDMDMYALAEEDAFVIEANKLPTNEETYNIQLNIENIGADWEGTVRLTVEEDYLYPTAYDTILSLPAGSTKQFVVRVPLNSMEDTTGTVTVTLLDKKEEVVQFEVFRKLLKDEDDCLVMGILSDDYAALTYLDMGGNEIYFYGDDYPIKLVEITQDNLENELAILDFFVIDTYNTGVLTEEELLLIEEWNRNGGMLVLGTGAYAEDTLAGFKDSYLGVECVNIMAPEENGYYYDTDYVNMSLLTIAELRENSQQFYNVQYNKSWTCSWGDGAIGILPYSLTELGTMGNDFFVSTDQVYFVMELLDNISMESAKRYNNSTHNNYYNYNLARRILRLIGSANSPLNFGVMRLLVIAYVIFAGPILYLILRMAKKRELYWVAVPIATLLGVVLIFFAGRGFEVVDTRVYSVTTEDLNNKEASSYLYCYDESKKEWELQLSDGYLYAGALMNEQYGYDDDGSYYHHVVKEGDVMSFGIRPSANFEDSFFYAGGKAGANNGMINHKGIKKSLSGIEGVVSNATDKDFAYFAVIADDVWYVFEGIEAGESCELQSMMPIYSDNTGDIWHDYLYNFLNSVRREENADKLRALSALGIGIFAVCEEETTGKTIIIGVVEDWDKVVDDKCSEMAYGCLYVVE